MSFDGLPLDKMKSYVLFLGLFVAVIAKHEVYQGWKSFYVAANSEEQFKVLQLASDVLDLDFITRPILGREGLVLVKPESIDEFVQILEASNIPYKLHSSDIKRILDKEDEVIAARKASRSYDNLPYHDYQEIEVIDAYLEGIAESYPEKVKLVQAGPTAEGRKIQYLKISTTNFEDTSKPVIIIDGGIHAREWIAPPVVTWAIEKLVQNVTEHDLLEKFDWILLPVVNPDGYKYTFSTERFWRKTRTVYNNLISYLCPGVDGNRNYDFFWNTVGSSSFPCSDSYAGPHAFSEVETRTVRDILQENLARTALYLTMHSYGSLILYPWGHDGTLSQNALALHTVGVAMANAIDAMKLPNFPKYTVGNSMLTIKYGTSGAAEDYAHSIGVPLAYTVELPGLEFGYDAFHLDPKYIQQVVHETWEAIVVGARRAGDLFPKK